MLKYCGSLADIDLGPAKIIKLKGTPAAEKGGHMVVNTEWGAFNNSVRKLLIGI